jgi:hypothetical protein
VTRYEARFTVGDATAQASFTVTDGQGSLVGALIAPHDEDDDYRESIAAFECVTARPLLARRFDYGSSIPDDLAVSNTIFDAGRARKSVLTFTPQKGCKPAHLDRFLGSCREAGIVADVAVWPEQHRFMLPVQYKVLCELYVPVIRNHGYRHVFMCTNYAAVVKDAMEAFWPGDGFVDAVGVSFYASGLSLTRAAGFADARGKPFGLSDFGVAHHLLRRHVDDSLVFLEYIEDFFADRISAGKPCWDLIWVDGERDGDFRFTLVPEFVDVYQRMCASLVT